MSSVYVVCWIFLQTFQTYFCIPANNVDPDQTAPWSSLIWVHTICKKCLLKSQADDKADDNYKCIVIGSLRVKSEFRKLSQLVIHHFMQQKIHIVLMIYIHLWSL